MPATKRRNGFSFVYLLRKRFALAFARRYQGIRSEDTDALPPLAIRAKLEAATASAFSLTIRRYSAGEQSLWAISNVRRMTVSHDARMLPLCRCVGSEGVAWVLRCG